MTEGAKIIDLDHIKKELNSPDNRAERFEITEEAGGLKHAVRASDQMALTVAGGKIFHRCARKIPMDKRPSYEVAWLVGELDGVRVYISGNNLIMSKEDLNP